MRQIIIDPNICNGQPIIEGTRITASTVIEFLSAGDSIDDVLAGYPSLTRDDVLACLAYSARLLKHHFDAEALAWPRVEALLPAHKLISVFADRILSVRD